MPKLAARVAYARRCAARCGAVPEVISAQASLLLASCGLAIKGALSDAPALLVVGAEPDVVRRLPPTVRGMALHQQLLRQPEGAPPNLGAAVREAALLPGERVDARAVVLARNAAQHPRPVAPAAQSVLRADAAPFEPAGRRPPVCAGFAPAQAALPLQVARSDAHLVDCVAAALKPPGPAAAGGGSPSESPAPDGHRMRSSDLPAALVHLVAALAAILALFAYLFFCAAWYLVAISFYAVLGTPR